MYFVPGDIVIFAHCSSILLRDKPTVRDGGDVVISRFSLSYRDVEELLAERGLRGPGEFRDVPQLWPL